MKNRFYSFFAGLFLILSPLLVSANPIDLSTFSVDPGAHVSESIVFLNEMNDLHAIYCYNDDFEIGNEATILSFFYSFILATDNSDYFIFELNYNSLLESFESASGTFSYDISALRGQTVSLAWGLLSDYDDLNYDSYAEISKIEIFTNETPAPVPEPTTFILFASGLLGGAAFSKSMRPGSTNKPKVKPFFCANPPVGNHG